MDDISKGTWLVNSYKHFASIRQDAPELSHFEGTDIAGKTGALLARLVADQEEIVPTAKVKAFARQSSIRPAELPVFLQQLKNQGKIDFTGDPFVKIPDVEVYCFSTRDALITTSRIYDAVDTSEYEQASLITLDKTFSLPRTGDELIETLADGGFSDQVSETTLKLQEALGLVKVSRGLSNKEPIFYNENAFSEEPEKITRAIRGLSNDERQQVEDIQQLVDIQPGYPLEELHQAFSPSIVNMMEGVGLLDAVTVKSEHAESVFVTGPQLKGISTVTLPLHADVFHKAKILLSSLRFGQLRSNYWPRLS